MFALKAILIPSFQKKKDKKKRRPPSYTPKGKKYKLRTRAERDELRKRTKEHLQQAGFYKKGGTLDALR